MWWLIAAALLIVIVFAGSKPQAGTLTGPPGLTPVVMMAGSESGESHAPMRTRTMAMAAPVIVAPSERLFGSAADDRDIKAIAPAHPSPRHNRGTSPR